ncbi:hypothetical protein PJIAN_2256 [Paludibacter jiangxiensis]|uniref:Uncharacterized protein n=1 Tax=Paludibacter jiangxiensis TaxID=681398 RepID=A0A170ZIA6_9BACT|nr:hypothetical protein PJIAN_2256 [Paludibacter jiangxiensis]
MKRNDLLCKNFEFKSRSSNRKSLKNLLGLVVMSMFFVPVCLQAQQLQEVTQMLNSMSSSGDNAIVAKGIHIQNLMTEPLPTIYLGESVSVSGGSQPVRLITEAANVSKLNDSNAAFAEVEMIIVKLKSPSDLNFSIDLPTLNGFAKLKYVLFVSEFTTNASDIQNLFVPNTRITVIYKVSIPS